MPLSFSTAATARPSLATLSPRVDPPPASRPAFHVTRVFRGLPVALLFSVFCLLTAAARAQSVRWEASDSGDPAELQLIFQDCAPSEDNPALPRLDGVTLALTGTSSQTNIVNFSMSRSTVLTYRARSTRSGPIAIPAFTVQTNKGALRVPAFTGGATRSAADANVSSRLEPGSATVWTGEVFPLAYTLDVGRRNFNQLGSNIDWNSAPLAIEEWSKFEPSELVVNGEARLAIVARTRAYAKVPGAITLNSATQLVNLQTGSVGFGLFQTPRIEQLTVSSDRPALTVRPLPAPAPAGFRGAVGQFKLASKIVPASAGVGEPITWTLELSGTGNWPDIAGLPQREVSKDFNVVQPHAKRTPAEGKLFDVTLSEDVVLVPTRAGAYTLGPIDFVYFDPRAGAYKTVSAPLTTITVTAPVLAATAAKSPAPSENGAATPPPREPAAAAPNLDALKSKVPTLPSGLPRDPLPGSDLAPVPLDLRTLVLLAASPFAALLLFWLWLAVRRARQTDPLRPRREARARLAATLARLKNFQPSTTNFQPQQRELLQWQHDTALLFQIPHAAPPAAILRDAAWTQLWLESDRALYSADTALPTDWLARAEAALAAKTLPSFSPLRLFLPQNLLPFVATIALLLAISHLPSALFAAAATADAASSYRTGDFPAAEKSWRAALDAHPTDSIARHNLSLALAQQDRVPEAAAHAAIAFIHNPSEPAIAWNLALNAEKAGAVPAPLSAFIVPGPLASLATHASPGVWQRLLVAAAVGLAFAFALLLLEAYRSRSRLRRWAAALLAVASLTLAASSVASLLAYGIVANRAAVIAWRPDLLRSIPTEADTAQKTVALPLGSVGLVEKSFLSDRWLRLAFPNGQTGWVRRDSVIPLWR